MTRYLFVSDVLLRAAAGTIQVGGVAVTPLTLAAGQPFTLWTDVAAGDKVTDCTAPDGTTPLPVTNGYFTADGNGDPPNFRGPDGVVALYLDDGTGKRYPIFAADLLAQVLGSAIGWLTGTGTPGAGGGTGVSDHGALSGLADDDHLQYLTPARGDLRYYTQAQADAKTSAAASQNSASDRDRANHTGTQAASTISNLTDAVRAVVGVPTIKTYTAAQGKPTAAQLSAAGVPDGALIVVDSA